MKHARIQFSTSLMAFFMAALVSYSCLMCLVDAFELTCDAAVLLAWCCAAALVSAGIMRFRRVGILSAVIAAAALVLIIWLRAPLWDSFQAFLFPVTSSYAKCYPNFSVYGQENGSPIYFLLLLALPLAWVTAWTTGREGSALLVLLACAPVLLLCLMIVDLAPVFWLILLTGALLMLLLSQGVRDRSPAEGNRLAWWLVLPTVILVAGITILWPPADYTRADWSQTLQTLAEAKISFQTLEQQVFSPAPRWSSSLRQVDLQALGPKSLTGQTTMLYRTDTPVSYLRGVSLGVYEKNTWSAVPQTEYTAQEFDCQPLTLGGNGSQAPSQLEIQTVNRVPMLYTTYYLAGIPSCGEPVDDAYVDNSSKVSSYAVDFQPGPPLARTVTEAYSGYVQNHYLQIPEHLRPALSAILEEIGSQAPEDIADYVRSSAVYDLNTQKLPDGKDFVLYFLQESHQGYCVHFASATAMLLRAAGIPARYVTGYFVGGAASDWVEVTEDQAHAWVEYYQTGTGWIPLDATPPEAVSAFLSTTEPVDTDVPAEPEPTVNGEPEPLPQTPQEPGDTPEPNSPSDSENPPVSTSPAANSDGAPARPPVSAGPWLWLLLIPALAGLLWLRRWLVLRRRLDHCRRGHPNRRALTMWRWLTALSHTDHTPLPEELLVLAEKARFSQHALTDQELAQLQEALDSRIKALQSAAPIKRLWYRFGTILF